MYSFDIRNNPNLTCTTVDDVIYSDNNWSNKDTQTSYNTFCPIVPVRLSKNYYQYTTLNIIKIGILMYELY